jgi:hypothetical protein
MRPYYILVHGIGEEGVYENTVGQLYKGLYASADGPDKILPFMWSPSHFWNVRKRAKLAGKRLAEHVKLFRKHSHSASPVNVVAHSAGALVIKYAMENGAVFNDLFLISPAISRDPKYPSDKYDRAFVFHNSLDIAVLFGSLLPFHLFGALGTRGFKKTDGKQINLPVPSKKGRWNHSSNWFEGGRCAWMADQIVQWSHTHYKKPAKKELDEKAKNEEV